jgi:hypothetical protein
MVEFAKFQGPPIRQCLLGTAAGLSLGLLYALKYTGAFLVVGAMMFIFAELILLVRRRAWSVAVIVSILACAIACCAPILVISVTNSLRSGSMNLVTASRSLHLEWETLLYTLANPVLAAAGADHLLARLCSDVLALTPRIGELVVAAAALPGAAGLWFLLGRRWPVDPAARLSCCILLASAACLAAIWTISWGASYEARHIAGAAMAFLPYAVEQASLLEHRLLKRLMRLLGAIYIALPLLYGATVFAVKLVRFTRYHPGPSGLYNQYFSGRDAARARELLLQGFDPTTDIWYVTHPLVAVDLPGRVLIRRIADMTVDELRKEVFHSRSRLRVRLVVPEDLATNGKASVVRKSFPHAEEWSLHPADPANPCWVSWIQLSSESELARPRPVLAR